MNQYWKQNGEGTHKNVVIEIMVLEMDIGSVG